MKPIQVSTEVHVNMTELMEAMSVEDVAELLNAVAMRFDSHFRDRRAAAEAFADHTSEVGARFLAEVIASTVGR